MLTGGGFNKSSFGIRIISLWKRRSRKCVKNIFGKVESKTVSSMNLAACVLKTLLVNLPRKREAMVVYRAGSAPAD